MESSPVRLALFAILVVTVMGLGNSKNICAQVGKYPHLSNKKLIGPTTVHDVRQQKFNCREYTNLASSWAMDTISLQSMIINERTNVSAFALAAFRNQCSMGCACNVDMGLYFANDTGLTRILNTANYGGECNQAAMVLPLSFNKRIGAPGSWMILEPGKYFWLIEGGGTYCSLNQGYKKQPNWQIPQNITSRETFIPYSALSVGMSYTMPVAVVFSSEA